ncbi:hypothetical protein GCM10029978_080830 [Actinoallomurus acanthiterrae]
MAERPTSSLVKRAAGVAQPVAKKVESTVKTVAKEAQRGGGLGPKVASSAVRSIGAAGAKSVVTGGINALKEAGGQVLGKNGKGGTGNKVKVTNIVEEIDIGASRRFVYDQWTRFQEFPDFMKKVQNTEQVADEKLRWKAKIFWSTRTWESTIVEQAPDERIVWRSTGDKGHVNGAVTFHELSSDLTRVLLVLEYHPKGFMEKTGNIWRAQGRRARLELKHFRRHVMAEALLRSGDDTEGWRGEIHDSEVATSHEDAVKGEQRKSDSDKSDGRTGSRSRRASRSSGSDKTAKSDESSDAGKSSGTRRSSAAKKSSTSSRSRSNSTSSSGTRRTTAKRSSGSQKSGSEEKAGAQEK